MDTWEWLMSDRNGPVRPIESALHSRPGDCEWKEYSIPAFFRRIYPCMKKLDGHSLKVSVCIVCLCIITICAE